MKFKSIEKIHQGKFITRYDVNYETENGRKKRYEMISRNPNIKTFEDLHDSHTDAVVMIMHDAKNEQILLSPCRHGVQQYRLFIHHIYFI